MCRGSGISTEGIFRTYTTGRVWRLDEPCQGFKPRFETAFWLGPFRTAREYFPALDTAALHVTLEQSSCIDI